MSFAKNRIAWAILPCLLAAGIWPRADGQQKPENQQQNAARTNTLTVIVTDRDQRAITDLTAGDFNIYKDGQPQQILSAGVTDVPACLGILLDSSGSTGRIRPVVAAAIYNFVKAGNPDDEAFLVNFNDRAYMDTDFTKDPNLIREGLGQMGALGNTALYDAVFVSASHFAKRPDCARRILLVLSHGKDNRSTYSIKDTLAELKKPPGVTVYAIGLSSEKGSWRAALENLALQTGGVAWFIDNINDSDKALVLAAEQIRHQYRITYATDDATSRTTGNITVQVSGEGRNGPVARIVGQQM